MQQLRTAQRPLLILGHGIRLAGAQPLVDPLLDHLGVPALVSWAGRDMTAHPLVYGSCGVYGNRAANHIVQQADFILAIGTRLSILQTGYDLEKFAPQAQVVLVDIDAEEAHKYNAHRRFSGIVRDAGDFIRELMEPYPIDGFNHDWMGYIYDTVERFPVIEECHADPPGFISPYLFLKRLEPYLKPDAVIVTDSGGALLCSHQVLTLKPPQRLITTTGLGEMGFGLPGAIGASFARNKGEVICLNTDGGMMFNLQELSTIRHHQLPIKIFVFSNDGYGMIRASQDALGLQRVGSDRESGVSMPNFVSVAHAHWITARTLASWDQWENVENALASRGPYLIEVLCSPKQLYQPKVNVVKLDDGKLRSPSLDEMSPLLVEA